MPVNPKEVVTELFQQAADTFDAAMKTGVKFQEETTKWWSEALHETGSIQDWQQRAQAVTGEILPTAEKNAEEYLRAIEESSRSSLELLKKAFESGQSETIADMQSRTQALWEASLAALRTNTQALVQANARTMASWAEFARSHANGRTEASAPPAAK